MDAKSTWKISSKVEGLVEAVVAVRKELFDIVKKRHPYSRSLKIKYCDVHVSPKVCQLLEAAQMWKDCKPTDEDFEVRRCDHFPHSQEMVADFELFKLIKDAIVGDGDVRIVIEFDTGGGEWESYYGNVELLS